LVNELQDKLSYYRKFEQDNLLIKEEMKELKKQLILKDVAIEESKIENATYRSTNNDIEYKINIEKYETLLHENKELKDKHKIAMDIKDKEIIKLNNKLDLLSEKIVVYNYIQDFEKGDIQSFIKDFKVLKSKYLKLKKDKESLEKSLVEQLEITKNIKTDNLDNQEKELFQEKINILQKENNTLKETINNQKVTFNTKLEDQLKENEKLYRELNLNKTKLEIINNKIREDVQNKENTMVIKQEYENQIKNITESYENKLIQLNHTLNEKINKLTNELNEQKNVESQIDTIIKEEYNLLKEKLEEIKNQKEIIEIECDREIKLKLQYESKYNKIKN